MEELKKYFEECIETGIDPNSKECRQLYYGKLLDHLEIDLISDKLVILLEFVNLVNEAKPGSPEQSEKDSLFFTELEKLNSKS